MNASTAFVGTYTRAEGHVDGKAEGVYQIGYEEATGEITSAIPIALITNPSFLSFLPGYNQVLAVSELSRPDEPHGYLHLLQIEGQRAEEKAKISTGGKAPCHIEIDQSGRFAIVSNYLGGVATVYQLEGDVPSIASRFTVDSTMQHGRQSHLHSAQVSPDNRLVAIADLGLDRIWLFNFVQSIGELKVHPQIAVELASGTGPRHLEWSSNSRHLYVVNELNSTVDLIGYNPEQDRFSSLQSISTLPADFNGSNFCADIHLHPNGRFLYASNRGHNSIASFAIHPETGQLSTIGHTPSGGDFPRNFAVTPGGDYVLVANQNSSSIVTLEIDTTTGALHPTPHKFTLPTPVCIEFSH